MTRTRGALAVALFLLAAAAPGCGRPPDVPARFVSVAAIRGFDPVDSGDMYSSGAMEQVYEGLYEYEYLKRPLELKPCLADGEPEVSEDGVTYTFRIKRGVVFQDSPCFPDGKGREITAHDFVYCWKRLMAVPSSTGSWLLEAKIEGLDEWAARARKRLSGTRDPETKEVLVKGLYDTVNEYYPYEHPDMAPIRDQVVPGLIAVDDHTLQVRLAEPYPQFIWVTAMNYLSIYPREALEYFGMDIRTHPVGTGPYGVAEYWPFSLKIRFKRNPTFHGDTYPTEGAPGDEEAGLLADAGKQLPFIDEWEFVVIENSQPRWLQFREGQIDRVETEKDIWEEAMDVDGALRQDLVDAGIRVSVEPLADIAYTAFNMEHPILGLPAGDRGRQVRQAMSLAYDQKGWIKVMRNGFWATPAYNPLPPTVAGHVDVRSPYSPRDLDRARALLVEAGYPGGRGLPPIDYEMSGTSSTSRNGAEILRTSMKKIGIEINLSGQTWDQFMDKVRNKNAPMFGMAWSADYPDAQNFLQLFYGPSGSPGPNNSNFKNAEYDRLYEQISVMQPGPERKALIRRMVEIVNEECPWMYTDHRVKYSYSNPWLKNFKYLYTMPWAVKYYRIDEAEKARRMASRRGGQ